MRLRVVQCPACGAGCADSHDERLLLRQDAAEPPFLLSRCGRCSHRYLSDPPTSEKISSYYNTGMGQLMHDRGSKIFDFLRRKLLALEFGPFIRRIGHNARLLDIGSGDGSLCQWLSRQNVNVLATDIYPSSDWPFPSIPYMQSDVTSTFELHSLISSLSINSIIMRHVLEHFYNPMEIFHSFRDSGIEYISITVPSYHSRLRPIIGENWCMWDPPRHLQHFTKESLLASAGSAGFTCIRLRTYGIDEVITSLYRYLLISANYRKLSDTKLLRNVLNLLHPKSPLAGISSAISFPFSNTVLSASFAVKS